MLQNELERIIAVNRFLNLEFSKEKELQDIVTLAAKICKAPIALITLLDQDTQHVKFRFGTDLETTERQDAFCNRAIEQQEIMMVPDATADERFANNPLVTGSLGIRFYAGSPITTQDGHKLGSLCVIDLVPNQLDSNQQQMLQALSKHVIHLLEFDSSLKLLKDQFIEAKSSEIKLRSFFESSSSGHLLLGKNMEILAFNKAIAEFIENIYAVRVTEGMKIVDFVNASFIQDFTDSYRQALSGTSIQLERQMQDENIATWWSITFDPARDSEGKIIGVSYNATDITARLAQEQRVLTQNESLKKIAYIQSHEIRRPVASIMGLMNILERMIIPIIRKIC